MKCAKCGHIAKEYDKFCSQCGAAYLEESNKRADTNVSSPVFQLSESVGSVTGAGKYSVNEIERNVEDYYMKKYLGCGDKIVNSEALGKIVVLHEDTKIVNRCCNVIVRNQKKIGDVITSIPVADVSVNMDTGFCFVKTKEKNSIVNASETQSKHINVICAFFLIWCIIFWVAAPFAAVNLFTWENPPTAWELVFANKEILLLGEVSETPAYLAAVTSMIGIVVCTIATFCKKDIVTRVASVITSVLVLLEVNEIIRYGGDFESAGSGLGSGFWAVVIMLFVVFMFSFLDNNEDSEVE